MDHTDQKHTAKEHKQELRRAYKKQKRKRVLPWKLLSITSCILAVICIALNIILGIFDNTMAAFFGGTFWKLENEDSSARYFTSDFASSEEEALYGLRICQQVEAEGAALLLNENHALPLSSGDRVSCFSTSSVNLVYGGTGSGNVDASSADTLQSALIKSGFAVNDTLWNFYTKGQGSKYLRKIGGTVSTDPASISEAPWAIYTDDVLSSVKDYSDAAIVVLSRVGGEGADLDYNTVNYLALDQNEQDMLSALSKMKSRGTVKKLVVLINSANPLQVDFLKNNDYDIDACLWIGDVGISGINAVAEILAGTVTPSGSLVDTYCYDNYSAPAMSNFTPITYEGYDGKAIPEHASTYMIYQEGIYVGYKYYETRYEDVILDSGNPGSFVYDDVVAFPFGYGLSYTTFSYQDFISEYNASNDCYELSITVTNTGSVAGKEPVQIYVQSPYTDYDVKNGVEKAAVSLVGFSKTKELVPGESQTLHITVDRADLASYDTYGAGTYILDAGDYYFTAATDAHNAVNNILAAKGYETDGDAALAVSWHEDALDTTTYATSKAGARIENQLSVGDPNLNPSVNENVVWLSRSNWSGTLPNATVKLTLTKPLIDSLQDVLYDTSEYIDIDMPPAGISGGLKLYDMMGAAYDDPRWEKLLDQITFDEMVSLIGDSFHWTMPVVSVQAPGTRDENGPQGLTASLLASDSTQLNATAFTSEDVMAATFNTSLMAEIGKVIGNNCLAAGVSILYGPGNNIHRTPYGGRNFEYYSEDAFLSGKMSAHEIAALNEKGIHVTIKHFALNDCEQDRIGLGVWLNEQAAREIYLKAFQDAFEEGNAGGVMTAYTRWGPRWSGSNWGLMTGILRKEWGSLGLTITDNVLTTYCNGVDGLLAGGISTYDAMLPYVIKQLPQYKDDPIIVTAMREACHHNLYTIANSAAMNGIGENTTIKPVGLTILKVLTILSILFVVLFIIGLVLWVRGNRRLQQTNEALKWRNYKKS